MFKAKHFAVIAILLILGQPGFAQTRNTGKVKPVSTSSPAVKTSSTTTTQSSVSEIKGLLGSYDLYAGTPSVYIGHIVLMADGKYKAAFSTNESDYEQGTYSYHADTNSLEWLTGLCKRNEWTGKLIKKSGGYRIEFSKTTFAEN